jgi:hypothetical protein
MADRKLITLDLEDVMMEARETSIAVRKWVSNG